MTKYPKGAQRHSNVHEPSEQQLPLIPNPNPNEPPPAANDDQEKARAANDDQEKSRSQRRRLPPPRPPGPPPVGVGDDGNGCPFYGQEALVYQGLLSDPDFPRMTRRQRQDAGKRLTRKLPRGHQICLPLTPPNDPGERIGMVVFHQKANGPHGVVRARNCRGMLETLNARNEFMRYEALMRRLNAIINAVVRARGLTR